MAPELIAFLESLILLSLLFGLYLLGGWMNKKEERKKERSRKPATKRSRQLSKDAKKARSYDTASATRLNLRAMNASTKKRVRKINRVLAENHRLNREEEQLIERRLSNISQEISRWLNESRVTSRRIWSIFEEDSFSELDHRKRYAHGRLLMLSHQLDLILISATTAETDGLLDELEKMSAALDDLSESDMFEPFNDDDDFGGLEASSS